MPEERKFSTENKKQEMNGHGSPGEKLKSNQIVDGPGSPREKSIVSLISDGLKLEFAAGDPAGGLRTKLFTF